jgi:hypothetical protein
MFDVSVSDLCVLWPSVAAAPFRPGRAGVGFALPRPGGSHTLAPTKGASPMLGIILVLVGAALMLIGLVLLGGWVGGRSGRVGGGVLDRHGDSKTDRQFLALYFIVLVVAPLLGGAILIAFGLRHLG